MLTDRIKSFLGEVATCETNCHDEKNNLDHEPAADQSGMCLNSSPVLFPETRSSAEPVEESGDDPKSDHVVEDRVVAQTDSVSGDSDDIRNDPVLCKYWWQRYRLFSRFDQGIRIDTGNNT